MATLAAGSTIQVSLAAGLALYASGSGTIQVALPNAGPLKPIQASGTSVGPFDIPTTVNLTASSAVTYQLDNDSNPYSLSAVTDSTGKTVGIVDGSGNSIAPIILAQSAVPVMIAQSGAILLGAGAGLVPGVVSSTSVTLSATSGSVTVTLGAAVLAGNASDVGKQITFYDNASATWRSALITASSSTTVCTATLASTVSGVGPHTGSNNFAFGTPLPTNYTGGIWVYLPAGAVVGGSAGFFWCTASFTATANGILQVTTAYQSSMGVPQIPTGFSNAVGSGTNFTGVTTQQTLASVVVPGGSMGNNGKIRYEEILSMPATSGNKTAFNIFGGQTLFGAGISSNTKARFLETVANRGVSTSQVAYNNSASFGIALSGSPVSTTVNTAIDNPLVFAGVTGTSSDFFVLEGFTLELLPRA
jgi:hypothetical protein